MSTYIAARPTTYRGIKMRSRLEARVASELDTNDYTWTYEPRAYAGVGGQYLPDFELTGAPFPLFMEVRPTLERALQALTPMTVIWESEPDAHLVVLWPDADRPNGWQSLLASPPDRKWRRT